jgi:hypothetical protein
MAAVLLECQYLAQHKATNACVRNINIINLAIIEKGVLNWKKNFASKTLTNTSFAEEFTISFWF